MQQRHYISQSDPPATSSAAISSVAGPAARAQASGGPAGPCSTQSDPTAGMEHNAEEGVPPAQQEQQGQPAAGADGAEVTPDEELDQALQAGLDMRQLFHVPEDDAVAGGHEQPDQVEPEPEPEPEPAAIGATPPGPEAVVLDAGALSSLAGRAAQAMPTFLQDVDRAQIDEMVRLLAQATAHYGGATAEAIDDVASKFHITTKQVDEVIRWIETAEPELEPEPELQAVGVEVGVGAMRPPSECRSLPTLPERNAAVLGWVHSQHLVSAAGDRAVATAAAAADVAVTPVRGRESAAFANQPGGVATVAAVAAAGSSADEVVGRALRRVVRMCVRGSVAPPLLCSAVRGLLDAARCSSPRYQQELRRVVGTHGWLGQRFRWALPAEQQQQLARELAAAKDCVEQQQQQLVGTGKGEQAVTALLLDAETQREGELHCWASNAVAKPLQSGKPLHRFWSHDWVRATM
jgi:hypothetical protein